MPLPNPRVFTAFLNEYLQFRRTHTWSSVQGILESLYRDNEVSKSGTCLVVNRMFYADSDDLHSKLADKLQAVEGWVKLLTDLTKYGTEQSMLSATIHAIRTYAIAKLQESDLAHDFNAYIDALRHEANEQEAGILRLMAEKKSKEEVDALIQVYHFNLIKLSQLGDTISTCKAMRAGLFPNLLCPDLHRDAKLPKSKTLNENIPFYFQPNYFLFHYEFYYRSQDHLQISFEEFERRCEGGTNQILQAEPQKSSTPGMLSGIGSIFRFPSFIGGNSNPASSTLPGAEVPKYGQ
ncbi:hypothetical protein AQUSIP_26360 [Aquicella siphonis]|uniref:Uncharacterized protein n=1 Tax=Aquicella siphonis TaxID=254247 RepID=A0A5E4PJP2_9COXI|nr:hypothetical protein [Aquicella siphonis]VVC77309.1 hypothetical protein AQUSIP_26360 [Aquicella siphonis]